MGTSSSAERPQPYRQDILKRVAFLEKIASIKGPFKKDFHRFCSRQIELAQSKNAVDPSKHAWGVVARPDKIMQQFPMRSDECIALAESAVFGWSLSKPVVGFDPELSAALDSQPTGARLQVEALQRLSGNPVFFPGEGECVGSLFFDYVAPYKNEAEAGVIVKMFICIFKWDGNSVAYQCAFQGISETGDPLAVEIDESFISKALLEGVAGALDYRTPAGDVREEITRLVRRIFYFCSDMPESDIFSVDQPRPQYKRNQLFGLELVPRKSPYIHIFGEEFGDQMRRHSATTEADSSRTVRPHIRRAHWHNYWTGSKNAGNRKLKLVWLHPIFIHSTAPQRA